MTARAEIIDKHDEPHVLVHWPPGATEADIIRAAEATWEADADVDLVDYMPDAWRVGACDLWRWVPANDLFGDYDHLLLAVSKPGRGAFWAVEVWPVYATEGVQP